MSVAAVVLNTWVLIESLPMHGQFFARIRSHMHDKLAGKLKLAMTNVLSITIVHLWEQEFVQLNIEPGTTRSKDSQYSLTFFTSIEPERLIGG